MPYTELIGSSPKVRAAALSLILALLIPFHAGAQEQEAAPAQADANQQALVDLDALVVASQVSTRCALFDSSVTYLEPIEVTAIEYRIEQLSDSLRPTVQDLADRMSTMRGDAAAIACGHEGLVPFLDFGRQVAGDMIDTALLAWQSIEVEECSYFADSDFMSAVQRAEFAASALELSGPAARTAFIRNGAAQWTAIFASNCQNLSFDPTRTLPGLIALALPLEARG
ncbi:hypothetical protein [Pelagibacterium montanilacus]|uniref:hypothetical protein n=1 Tax=Pelagibacterium montanilacus TaxID=2185280 RepID=UPI000F8C532F|nr:hypothetical protein [Pelagibacterium montanilacus]